MTETICVIGCGDVFEQVVATSARLDARRRWRFERLASTDEISQGAERRLEACEMGSSRVFVAVDAAALNHARLELYGKLRLMGFVGITLVDPTARVDASVQLGENCWIGPGAHVGPACSIATNVFVGTNARLDGDVKVGASAWLGAGCSLGRGAAVGTHCVLGDDVRVARGVVIGRYCIVDQPATLRENLADGTFLHPAFGAPVRLHAPPARRGARKGP